MNVFTAWRLTDECYECTGEDTYLGVFSSQELAEAAIEKDKPYFLKEWPMSYSDKSWEWREETINGE